MRTYVGDQEAWDAFEFEEPACGFDPLADAVFPALFAGVGGEATEASAARLDVAGEVLAELLAAAEEDEVAWLNALYAAQLMGVVPLRSGHAVEPGTAPLRRAA
ncbi:hypothetical protein [Streptomyces sp. CC77]|uniref:hypothetical protein n=1 Tax=Streptomyces sp. CC77 TaxID=1906739 RepID=UPI0020C849A9|nr:hypothetical protein [Streptomyces sp. CC77]